ncbi:thioredoxin H-type isoform X1 [Beta vulgaris subsp. vulgaris]|uniref:thioredoxin H-type isoform X1 n=1 Tax=Beta vulgaris subsp. vulgaris TaxID=3555 RepID=UPI00203733C6|nr:thioredoxin H-type isoform X1 [Beta vulgaris subsp. vulgaris]
MRICNNDNHLTYINFCLKLIIQQRYTGLGPQFHLLLEMGNRFARGKPPAVVAIHSTEQWNAHFELSKSSAKLMVVDFSASWCGPCQYMEPIIKDLSTKYGDVEFVNIDVDELSDVASEFGVDAMPTFVFFKKGKEVERLVGANKGELKEKITKHRV